MLGSPCYTRDSGHDLRGTSRQNIEGKKLQKKRTTLTPISVRTTMAQPPPRARCVFHREHKSNIPMWSSGKKASYHRNPIRGFIHGFGAAGTCKRLLETCAWNAIMGFGATQWRALDTACSDRCWPGDESMLWVSNPLPHQLPSPFIAPFDSSSAMPSIPFPPSPELVQPSSLSKRAVARLSAPLPAMANEGSNCGSVLPRSATSKVCGIEMNPLSQICIRSTH